MLLPEEISSVYAVGTSVLTSLTGRCSSKKKTMVTCESNATYGPEALSLILKMPSEDYTLRFPVSGSDVSLTPCALGECIFFSFHHSFSISTWDSAEKRVLNMVPH